MSISLPLASIILFVDFAISIVMRPSMSFIKGLVIGARIQCYDVIEPPPSHWGHKFHNFHTFQKNRKISRNFHVIFHVKFKILIFHEIFKSYTWLGLRAPLAEGGSGWRRMLCAIAVASRTGANKGPPGEGPRSPGLAWPP